MGVILPDSEFVYGPSLDGFDTDAFVTAEGGYLAAYQESVDGVTLSGAQIVTRVAQDYSVNTRLLLALIQAQSSWVRDPAPVERSFPIGEPLPGLYPGLSAAADALNSFYYGYRFQDQQIAPLAGGGTVEVPSTNAATFALLAYLGRNATALQWAGLEQPSRFQGAWMTLFGDPSNYVGDTAMPAEPPPIELKLPFPAGEIWYFVAGPHSPWGAKGPRAAIDFAPPPATATGCFPSGASVTAAAPGRVTRSSASGLVVSLEGSQFEGTGWAHVYSHLHPADRAAVGARVQAGERLGYPGCEGGLPTQTRVAFARKYQGEWIPADALTAPLVLDGWTALPGQAPGEGFLIRTGANPRVASPEKSDAGNGVTAGPPAAGP
jgi:LasA protease